MSKQPLAMFTIVKDEPEFLPVWLQHYRRQAPNADIYILDNDSTYWIGDIDHLSPCSVVPIYNDKVDHAWMLQVVKDFQRFLLQSYRYVLFAEVDELIIPNANAGLPDTLSESLSLFNNGVIRCRGYEVVQQGDEPVIDFDVRRFEPGQLLANRGSWYPCNQYSKPAISRTPTDWCLGFHACPDLPDLLDPHPFLMLHLHKLDWNLCVNRTNRFRDRNWSATDIAAGAGFQNRMPVDTLQTWFRQNADRIGEPQPLEPIPDWIKALV